MQQNTYLDFDRALPNEDGTLNVEYKWRHSFDFDAGEILTIVEDEDE
jgi:hypothetical protein